MNEGEPQAPVVEGAAPDPQVPTTPDVGEVQREARADLLATVLRAPMSWPRPEQYRDVTPDMITRCSTGALIAYSRAAQSNKDWEAAAAFQGEIVRREPNNTRAHVFLSFALENIGELEEAARVWETLTALPGYEPNPRYAHRPTELRARLRSEGTPRGTADRTVRYDLPSSHIEVTPEMLPTCRIADLIRYSVQAQKDKRWDRVEMFQWELVKRQPHDVLAHVLLTRAFVEQGKMEDAADLMQTVRELRTPHDDERITKMILAIEYRLGKGARTQPRLLEAEKAPTSASASARAPTAAAPVALARPSNIDTSRFDNFLTSIRREAELWPQVQGQGEGWRRIPEDEHDFFAEAFEEFGKQLTRAIPKGPNKAFWGKFEDIRTQIHRGAINVHALDTLTERTENTARGAKVELGRLEPIRLKSATMREIL